MKRGRSTGNPTKAQRARWDDIHEIGCVIAMMRGLSDPVSFNIRRVVQCEIHHFTIGGKHGQKRRGHDYTIGLNPWSHRGEPFGDMTAARCEALLGPSYALTPRRFREEFGGDDVLLGYQDELIAQLRAKRAAEALAA